VGWATALSVLVFGSSGQVGRSLLDVQENRKAFFVSRKDCELTDIDQIKAVLEQKRPSIIINAAAYTSVDSAEQESNRAHLVNEVSVRCMASYARVSHAKLIHFSTDFVFDGKQDSPYQPEEYTNP
jgi:dTDP-4-dehydrorhamnose reductase